MSAAFAASVTAQKLGLAQREAAAVAEAAAHAAVAAWNAQRPACVVCRRAPADTTLVPCAHRFLCGGCAAGCGGFCPACGASVYSYYYTP